MMLKHTGIVTDHVLLLLCSTALASLEATTEKR